MATEEKTIFVYADWNSNQPILVGRLFASSSRGKDNISFEYSNEWIKSTDSCFVLDPDLYLYEGRQYTAPEKSMFGVFTDSCPDRWGRLLMKRREAIRAREENRKPRTLTEIDYLLGVYDKTRMGALRFSLEENGVFLSSEDKLSAPPWTSLRTLETASLAFENSESDEEYKWLSQLLEPGSSLGGARPKASVEAPDGSLWIAKFPSKNDEWNVGAWEMVAHKLASLCGLNIPDARVATYSDYGSTFIVKRFDRHGKRRIHFSSAMALLGKSDGDGSEGVSYIDIASFIKASGASPKKDLEELWKRIVFNMAISNTDDHLRNHGFLLMQNGWTLSPIYDINPSIYGDSLSLNVSMEDSTISYNLAYETAEIYGIGDNYAKSVIDDFQRIVRENWQSIAMEIGMDKNSISRMSPAFI